MYVDRNDVILHYVSLKDAPFKLLNNSQTLPLYIHVCVNLYKYTMNRCNGIK